MTDIIIKVKRDGDNSNYEDGDIVQTFTDKRIKSVYAEHICHRDKIGFKQDGRRPDNSLTEMYLQKVSEYKFERISENEVRRTNIETQEQDVISGTPNEKGEQMDVSLFVKRRLKHNRHLVFGEVGSERWYGGNTNKNKIYDVWKEIEKRTDKKEIDHAKFPCTDRTLTNYLVIKSEDLTDEEARELMEPLNKIEMVEGKPEVTQVKKRKNKIDWKNNLGLSESLKAQILDKKTKLDLREQVCLSKTELNEKKEVKTVLSQ